MRTFGGFSVFACMGKTNYIKIPKSFEDQLKLLKKRGLDIPNEEKAKKVLQNISYNRLSAYWYPLLDNPKDEEIFKPNSSFETAFHFYQFDSELRILIFHSIEQIEIAFRTQLIYHLSHKYGSGFWYERSDAFVSFPNYVHNLNKICNAVKDSRQEFIKKYNRKYNQYLPPAWKSFEIISFRTLYAIYNNLIDVDSKRLVSNHFGVHHKVFISWMNTLVYIRNICAHHSRLWNIRLTISPIWLKSPRRSWVERWENEIENENTNDKNLKLYAVLCILQYLLNHINPYNNFSGKLTTLLIRFPEIDTAHIGMTSNWKEEPLWKKPHQ